MEKFSVFCVYFVEFFEEYRDPDISSSSGKPLELDFFYPQLKLALEFQVEQKIFCYCVYIFLKGSQHYKSVELFHSNSLEQIKSRDQTKYNALKNKGA